MALHKTSLFSTVLKREINLNIIIPTKDIMSILSGDTKYQNHNYPLVVLLHGTGDNHDSWLNNSNIVEYANKFKVAIVMPAAENTYYANTKYGLNIKEFIGKELIEYMHYNHPVSNFREDTYIIGNSMGGYGAVNIGLNYTDVFGHIGSFSGSLDLLGQYDSPIATAINFEGLFGTIDEARESINDNLYLVSKIEKVPSLYIACGSEDFNLQSTKKFVDVLNQQNINHEYIETPGSHTWNYWNQQVEIYFEKFLKTKSGGRK